VRHVWVCFLGLFIGLFIDLFIGLSCSTGLSCWYHLMCASVIVDFVSVTVDFVIPVCETGQEGEREVEKKNSREKRRGVEPTRD